MKTQIKIAIISTLAFAAIGGANLWAGATENTTNTTTAATNLTAQVAKTVALPRLVDLGANKCIPCKAMAPILEELKKDYAGQLNVEFIDVWKNPDAGKAYGVEMIPTQIFYDSEGKELFRHTGFYAKEDILAKWAELGVKLPPVKSEKK